MQHKTPLQMFVRLLDMVDADYVLMELGGDMGAMIFVWDRVYCFGGDGEPFAMWIEGGQDASHLHH